MLSIITLWLIQCFTLRSFNSMSVLKHTRLQDCCNQTLLVWFVTFLNDLFIAVLF